MSGELRIPGAGQTATLRVRTRVQELIACANSHYGLTLGMPEIRFDLRGLNAGQADTQNHSLRFNRELLLTQPRHFLHHTVAHEVAHLVAYVMHGARIRPHGPQWRAVMEFFDADPSRCHNYPARPSRRLRQYSYYCGCRRHRLTSIRHNRARRGVRYYCVDCRERLRGET